MVTDPGAMRWPGCLLVDDTGHLLPAPFVQLYEHLREDPHWRDFGMIHVPETEVNNLIAASRDGSRLPWTVVYEWFYLREVLRLRVTVELASLSRVHEHYEQLGRAAPLPLPAFAVRPICDALRVHMGVGPLDAGHYRPVYRHAPECAHRKFKLYFGKDLVAQRVNERPGARDNDMVTPLIDIHRRLRRELLEDAVPRLLVRVWHILRERGREMIAWLESISIETLTQGRCSGCEPSSTPPTGASWLHDAQAWIGSRESRHDAAAATASGAAERRGVHPTAEPEEVVGAVEEFHQEVSLQPGETKNVLNMEVPEGHVAVLWRIPEVPPGVIAEIRIDGKRFRY